MKKIKCESCVAEWLVEDMYLEKLRVCPYCSESIYGEIEFSEYDTLGKAIYAAVTKMGINVLQNPRQLSGFMMDTAPNLKKEIRIFSKTVTDDYTTYVKTAFEEDVTAAEVTMNKLHRLFVDEEGLSDTWAEMICSALYGAILYFNGVGTSALKNIEVSDYKLQSPTPATSSSVTTKAAQVSPVPKAARTSTAKFDVLKNYECLICGYVEGGRELTDDYNGACPICKASSWEEWQKSEKSTTPQSVSTHSQPSKSSAPAQTQALMETAEKYLRMDRIDDALELYRQIASTGWVPAYIVAGNIYTERKNYKKAWKWYVKASEANDPLGHYYVGYYYQKGLHVQKNSHLAVKYYEKAVASGLPQAYIAIAELYKSGSHYAKDVHKAIEYFETAAIQGYAEAQYKLGMCYQLGDGVDMNLGKAAEWFTKAASQGYRGAKERLDECIRKMPLTQRMKWSLQKR